MDKLEQHARDSILGGMCAAILMSQRISHSAKAALEILDPKKIIDSILEDPQAAIFPERVALLKDGELRPIIEQEARQLIAAMQQFIGME